MSWTSSLWADDYGWAEPDQGVELSEAFDERYRAKNNGSQWGREAATVNDLNFFRDDLLANMHDDMFTMLEFGNAVNGDAWLDTDETITDAGAAGIDGLAEANLSEWYNFWHHGSYYKAKLGRMIKELLYAEHDSISRWAFQNFNYASLVYINSETDFSTLTSQYATDSAANNYTSLSSTYPNFVCRQYAISNPTTYRIDLQCTVGHLQISNIWTGATSNAHIYAAPTTNSGVSIDNFQVFSDDPSLTEEKFHLWDSSGDDTTSSRTLVAGVESGGQPAWIDSGDINDPGSYPEDYGWISFLHDFLVVIDWSVTGGFSYQ